MVIIWMIYVEKFHIGKLYMVDYIFKTIILGNAGVGKTTLLYKYLYGTYMTNISSTIGVNYVSKKLSISDNIKIKLQIWDTAGQERFRSIIRSYFRNVSGCIIAYDTTNIESFKNCSYWIQEIINENPQVKILLLGTKNDLIHSRKVSFQTGKEFSDQHNILFFETSSKAEQNICHVFESLAILIYDAFVKNNFQTMSGITDKIVEKQFENERQKRESIIKCCQL